MAKTRRGKGIITMPGHGRGTCPVCKATGIKVLYDREVDGKQKKVCKRCQTK